MNFERLTSYLDHLVDDINTPSVDCIIYKEHKMIYRHFYGKKDIETNTNITGDELYFIFSLTKMVTCTAALQLYEKGKYNMEDPISKYLPEFGKMRIVGGGYAKNSIRVKHLFTMCAGLDYDLNADGIRKALAQGKTSTRDLVSAMSKTVLGFEPGSKFLYSLCHDVLGALIEVWSGKKLSEYMKENIFEPLGMKNTFFGLPKDSVLLAKMASLYEFGNDGKPKKAPLECPHILSNDYESGGAGLCSCPEDYSLFCDALACNGVGKTGNRILSSASIELMSTNRLNEQQKADFQSDSRPGYGYGLGVRVHTDKAESSSLSPIGEFGWDGAAGSFSMVDTKNKISLVYFQHIYIRDILLETGLRNALYSDLEYDK